MNETTHNVVPAPFDTLHIELRALIASSRQRLAGAVNAELTRMVKFAEAFPDAAIVSTLSAKLSWSHMVAIVAIKNSQGCRFNASQV